MNFEKNEKRNLNILLSERLSQIYENINLDKKSKIYKKWKRKNRRKIRKLFKKRNKKWFWNLLQMWRRKQQIPKWDN